MLLYFTFGLGFYIGVSVARPSYFKDSNITGIVRGFIFGVVFWPFAIFFILWLYFRGVS